MIAPFVLNKQVCYMKKRIQFGKEKKQIDYDLIRTVGIWAFKIILVCLLALVIVFYFGRQVKNSGDSMRPAVLDGDIVLVNRMIYDASKPKRGDIIVFKPNGNENARSYIKRIIGLPGETVQIKDGEIYIDGEKLEKSTKQLPLRMPEPLRRRSLWTEMSILFWAITAGTVKTAEWQISGM